MGSGAQTDLHPERWRRECHRCSSGFGRQVHGGCHGDDVPRSEDDHRRSDDPQRLLVPAGAWSRAAAGAWRAATGRGRGRTRPRAAGAGDCGVVHQNHVVVIGTLYCEELRATMRGHFAWLGAGVVLLALGGVAAAATQDTWVDGYGIIAYFLVPLAFVPLAAGVIAAPRANRF